MRQCIRKCAKPTFALIMLGSVATGAWAEEPDPSRFGDFTDRLDYFVFGGVMTHGTFPGWANVPLASPIGDSYHFGGAVNYEFLDAGHGFHFGTEVGLAARLGNGDSGEFWGGLSVRHDGFTAGPVSIGFGLVVGLSAVTAPTDIEIAREARQNGDARLLYYAGPEISLKFESLPNMEFVFRTHHRSGAGHVPGLPTLGGMADGSNANIFGVRFRL
jgi:hypothetical protein